MRYEKYEATASKNTISAKVIQQLANWKTHLYSVPKAIALFVTFSKTGPAGGPIAVMVRCVLIVVGEARPVFGGTKDDRVVDVADVVR